MDFQAHLHCASMEVFFVVAAQCEHWVLYVHNYFPYS